MARAPESRREGRWHRPALVAGLVAATGAVLITGFTGLPDGGQNLSPIARHAMEIALPRWGTTEVVSEVVYGSRGWDTFGETFLLLAAVVAVSVLSRGREPRHEYVGEASAGRSEEAELHRRRADHDAATDSEESEESEARAAERAEETGEPPAPDDADDDPLGAPAPERAAAMTVVVRVGARVAAPLLLVAGAYLYAWGYTPGGGFPAGAVLAGVAVLLYAALGHRAVRAVVRPAVLEPIELAGAAAIVALGAVGLATRGAFLANWLPLAPQQTIRAGGTLQVFSGAELVEVATGLSIAIFALLGMGHEWATEHGDDGNFAGGDQTGDDVAGKQGARP